MIIKTPKELKEISQLALEMHKDKIKDYSDNLCSEITAMMVTVAANVTSESEYNSKTSVSVDLSVNSKIYLIDTMRKNREIKYLSDVSKEVKCRFAKLCYEVESVQGKRDDYHNVKFSW